MKDRPSEHTVLHQYSWMKAAFSAIICIHLHFCLWKRYHKMPKCSVLQSSALQSSPFSLGMQWLLYRPISIQSPTRSQLPGTQTHTEQISVNLMVWFPQQWTLRRNKVKKETRSQPSCKISNNSELHPVFINLRSLWVYIYHLNQKRLRYHNFFEMQKHQCLPHRRGKYQVFISL